MDESMNRKNTYSFIPVRGQGRLFDRAVVPHYKLLEDNTRGRLLHTVYPGVGVRERGEESEDKELKKR